MGLECFEVKPGCTSLCEWGPSEVGGLKRRGGRSSCSVGDLFNGAFVYVCGWASCLRPNTRHRYRYEKRRETGNVKKSPMILSILPASLQYARPCSCITPPRQITDAASSRHCGASDHTFLLQPSKLSSACLMRLTYIHLHRYTTTNYVQIRNFHSQQLSAQLCYLRHAVSLSPKNPILFQIPQTHFIKATRNHA